MRTYNLKDGAISILNSAFVLSTHLSILDPVEQKLVFKVKKGSFLIKKALKEILKTIKKLQPYLDFFLEEKLPHL